MTGFNNEIRVAICDDSQNDRRQMRSALDQYAQKRECKIQVDEYSCGEQLIESKELQYDLVILDIYMEGMNGVQAAKLLRRENADIGLIFWSSSNEYAAESYDISALYYLLKPLEQEKLYRVLDRFFGEKFDEKTITFKSNRGNETIYVSDILWIEVDNHISILHTMTDDIATHLSLKQFKKLLGEDCFIQPIRYALVALHAVAAIPTDVLVLRNGTSVPISRNNRLFVRQAFSDYKMQQMEKRRGVM